MRFLAITSPRVYKKYKTESSSKAERHGLSNNKEINNTLDILILILILFSTK